MVEEINKDNLKTIFSQFTSKILCLSQFSSYLKQIFEDLTSRSENRITALDIIRFHLYMQFPYHISKRLFKSILESNQTYLTFEEFDNGLKQLYLESIPNQVKFLFHFYDINEENKVYPYDIQIILRHFHMMTNASEISLLNSILSTALKEDKPMDFNQWKELLVNNSDIFTLTILFFNNYKPYKEDNVIYCSKMTKTYVSKRDIPSKTYELLSDSTESLFNYINKQFNQSLQYVHQSFSDDDDDDMKDLMVFEEDKKRLLHNLEEISMGLSNRKISKKLFETMITSDSSTIKQEINYRRKKRNKEVSGTTIQSNFTLSKLKIRNGLTMTQDGKDSKGKIISQTIRFDCFKLYKNIVRKCFLNLINDELYLFKISKKGIKKFKQLICLKQFFLASEESVKLQGGVYFKVELLSDIEYLPFPTKFYFETKDSGLSFIRNINELSKYHDKIIENYEITDELMIEENGSILKAYNKKNLNTFLIKQITKKYKDGLLNYELINWELSTFAFLTKANHPSLIKAIERYESLNTIYLVYEFPTEGQLLFYQQRSQIDSLVKKMQIFYAITSSIKYLHSFGIVYGNCITSNAFVFKYKQGIQFKLINYELAQICSFAGSMPQLCVSSHNKAPELNDGSFAFDKTIDIWNMGQLLFSIIYGYKPYSNKDNKKKKIEFPEISLSNREQLQLNKIKEIITGCLQFESRNRLSLNKVIDLCIASN